jgi:hypothetical protein
VDGIASAASYLIASMYPPKPAKPKLTKAGEGWVCEMGKHFAYSSSPLVATLLVQQKAKVASMKADWSRKCST